MTYVMNKEAYGRYTYEGKGSIVIAQSDNAIQCCKKISFS